MQVNVKLEVIGKPGEKIPACRIHFDYSRETSAAVRLTNPSHWKLVERSDGEEGFSLEDNEGHHFVNVRPADVQESAGSLGAWMAMAYEKKSWSLALTVNLPDGGMGASFFKVDPETGKVLDATGPQRIGTGGPDHMLRGLMEALKAGDVDVRVLQVPKGMSPEDAIKAALDDEGHECDNCGACGKGKKNSADKDAEKADNDHNPNLN